MSRNYAQIFTAIWRDPDFLALRRTQQQAYFLLVTQPNISAAGVLPITERRWTKLAADDSQEELLADIAHLHKIGMVVVDEDTEELLVRSFIRHDNGYRNPRRQPSIRDAAQDVQSPRLRQALAVELVRLGCPGWLPEMTLVVGEGKDATIPDAEPPGEVFPQVNSHSSSRTHIDEMAIDLEPARTPTPNPQPAPRNPSVPPERFGSAAASPPDDGALFAAANQPDRKTPRQRPATEGVFHAGQVVAAYLEGAKEKDRTVTPDIIKQVGATAKRIISSGQVTPDQLLNAARQMGREGWKDLNVQLLRGNQTGRMNGGMQSGPTRRLHNSHDNQDRYDIKL